MRVCTENAVDGKDILDGGMKDEEAKGRRVVRRISRDTDTLVYYSTTEGEVYPILSFGVVFMTL